MPIIYEKIPSITFYRRSTNISKSNINDKFSRIKTGIVALFFICFCTVLSATTSTKHIPSVTESNILHSPLVFDKDQSKTALNIIQKLDRHHYIDITLNDLLSSRVLDNYLERLDPNKSVFLATDIAEFERYRFTIDNALMKGELNAGYFIFNRYQQRLIARLETIINSLPEMVADMNFKRKESLALERKQAPWPATIAETDDLWRKRIKSSVISLRISNKEKTAIVPLLRKRFQNQLNRVKQSNSADVFQIYLNSLTGLYDPHTTYLSPSSSENFNINMSLSLEGIGAVLQTEDEFTKVARLVHAGPADKQGQLQPSDRIIGVAQGDGEFQDIIGMRLDEVVQLIRGPKSSLVKLEVIPVSAKTDEERSVIEIIRDTVKLEEQSAQKRILEILHQEKLYKVGIIDVPVFYLDFDAMRNGDDNYKSTTRDVKKLLSELIAQEVDGIIIDLRENGGGSLQEANQLTGLFIESGPTVQIRHSNTKVYRDGKRSSSLYYEGPLAVLINRLSASASEIFAGAIQDYQRGIIIGTQSFGKGTVQSLTSLQQGQLKITESKFYRISGESTQHRGVIPDILFPSVYNKDKVGESSLDNALAWDRIDPIRHRYYYNIPSIIPMLQTRHNQRIKTDPDFIFLKEQLVLMEDSRKAQSITLNEQERRSQKEEEKQKGLAIENKRRIAKGLEPLQSLSGEENPNTSTSASIDSNTTHIDKNKVVKKEDEEDPIDPLLTETGHILMDALPIYKQQRMAITQKVK